MNFYETTLLRIKEQHYPQQYQVDRVIAAKRFIDNHSTNNITLDDIANSACLSKFHFLRLFSRCYGRTPHQYLTESRIAKAKLLLQSGASVSSTCIDLGFTSTTSFTALFKKITGTTPTHFQQKKQF